MKEVTTPDVRTWSQVAAPLITHCRGLRPGQRLSYGRMSSLTGYDVQCNRHILFLARKALAREDIYLQTEHGRGWKRNRPLDDVRDSARELDRVARRVDKNINRLIACELFDLSAVDAERHQAQLRAWDDIGVSCHTAKVAGDLAPLGRRPGQPSNGAHESSTSGVAEAEIASLFGGVWPNGDDKPDAQH